MRKILFILFSLPNFLYGQNHLLDITIHLTGIPDKTFFYLNEDNENIDSASSANEILKFKYFKKEILPTSLLILSRDRKQGYIFWIENSSIYLNGNYTDLSPLTTHDSKTQSEFVNYTNSTSPLEDSLSKIERNIWSLQSQGNPDLTIYKQKQIEIGQKLKQIKTDFINNNTNSIISAATLFFEIQHKRLTNEETLILFNQLSKNQQNSTYGQGILKSIELYKNPIIGNQAPEFILTDLNDNLIKLSDFSGKNIVLIFWASSCLPCIKEMPEIIQTSKDLKHKNVVFIMVSLDEKKEQWEKVIKENSKEFINLSDLKGWMNEAALMYGVSAIPDHFLINADGNIVVHNHLFREIKRKLDEL
ncbi:MAG: TlpA disulfide reductase family protein [Chitinophagaceae bacterium]